MKASTIVLAAAVMLTTGVATASAQSYTLVTGNDYAPFTDSKLPEGGIVTEVVKLAFAAADKQVTIEWKPWKRGYQDTLANDNDATFPYVLTDERKAEMLYSDAIFSVKQEVFAPIDKPLRLQSEADLAGHVVCQPLGYALTAKVEALIKAGSVKVQQPANLVECARMLAAGRADFMVGNVYVLPAVFKSAGVADQIKSDGLVLDSLSFHLLVSKVNPKGEQIIGDFNAGLKKLKSDGRFDEIVKRAVAG